MLAGIQWIKRRALAAGMTTFDDMLLNFRWLLLYIKFALNISHDVLLMWTFGFEDEIIYEHDIYISIFQITLNVVTC